jgi:predicted secreted Zn-dependent protease
MPARLIILALLPFISALMASGAFADPLVTEKIECYNIDGSTVADLRNQINSLGEKAKDGKRYAGFTYWNIKWRYQYRSNGHLCSISSVSVTIKIRYVYPKWSGRDFGRGELRIEWDRYIAALEAHERGHRDIAVAAAARIESAIAGMIRTNCHELGREANALGERILDDCRKRQEDYDAVTNHGITQGARLR